MVVGCIYKHPNLAVTEFNECYVQPLLDKLSLDKDVILMGDFNNADLLYYEMHKQSRDFLDKIFSASLKLHTTTHSLQRGQNPPPPHLLTPLPLHYWLPINFYNFLSPPSPPTLQHLSPSLIVSK